jgi:hypothetical protein
MLYYGEVKFLILKIFIFMFMLYYRRVKLPQGKIFSLKNIYTYVYVILP